MSSQLLVDLPIKIFADGADSQGIAALYAKPYIKGLTTNPTLMRKVGIADYEKFAREVLEVVKEKPISFEVFSDEFPEMRRQALHDREDGRRTFTSRSRSRIPAAIPRCRLSGSSVQKE